MSNQREAWGKELARRDLAKVTAQRAKYGNKKTVLDGLEFDSKKEANRWRELVLMQQAGQITELRRQVPFELWAHDLHSPVTDAKGSRTVAKSVASYIADFTYSSRGTRVVEDVKSKATKTAIYALKRKLFRANYGFDITEIL